MYDGTERKPLVETVKKSTGTSTHIGLDMVSTVLDIEQRTMMTNAIYGAAYDDDERYI